RRTWRAKDATSRPPPTLHFAKRRAMRRLVCNQSTRWDVKVGHADCIGAWTANRREPDGYTTLHPLRGGYRDARRVGDDLPYLRSRSRPSQASLRRRAGILLRRRATPGTDPDRRPIAHPGLTQPARPSRKRRPRGRRFVVV